MSTTSNKTKDWLKNQLVTHGVPLPAASAKKEEYQRLYEEQVLPQQNNTEFSSDDDTEPVAQAPPPRAPSVAKNSKPDSRKGENESDSVVSDSRSTWVNRLSDQNLFDALVANERDPGPILGSTRDLYRKMLLDLMIEDEKKVLEKIEDYLSKNKEARDNWLESGVDLNGSNGVHTNGNGNAENGFSDTDEDDALETASRASRSSRASSKRNTPTPAKGSPGSSYHSTPRSPFESKPLRARGSMSVRGGLNLNDSSLGARESEVTASSRYESSMSYSRVTTRMPPYRPIANNEPYNLNEEESEQTTSAAPPRAKNASKGAKLIVQYVLIFLVFIVAPIVGYLFYSQQVKTTCEGNGEDCPDELDLLLQTLDDTPNVPNADPN